MFVRTKRWRRIVTGKLVGANARSRTFLNATYWQCSVMIYLTRSRVQLYLSIYGSIMEVSCVAAWHATFEIARCMMRKTTLICHFLSATAVNMTADIYSKLQLVVNSFILTQNYSHSSGCVSSLYLYRADREFLLLFNNYQLCYCSMFFKLL